MAFLTSGIMSRRYCQISVPKDKDIEGLSSLSVKHEDSVQSVPPGCNTHIWSIIIEFFISYLILFIKWIVTLHSNYVSYE